ncbi:MAG: hypothetical protein HYU36_20010 [Planctomycetes bacterium]|nr:hypothetical protein [Planctomycetota bacterium]
MTHLHQILTSRTQEWAEAGCPCPQFPAIAEILEFQVESESGNLRCLRKAQLWALQTYGCLRFVEDPHIFEHYQQFFDKPRDAGSPKIC